MKFAWFRARQASPLPTSAKVDFLREQCGFDVAFDYKTGPVLQHLKQAAPDGIDVYFDNVGGEALEAALTVLRVHGRIIACGGISRLSAPTFQEQDGDQSNTSPRRLSLCALKRPRRCSGMSGTSSERICCTTHLPIMRQTASVRQRRQAARAATKPPS